MKVILSKSPDLGKNWVPIWIEQEAASNLPSYKETTRQLANLFAVPSEVTEQRRADDRRYNIPLACARSGLPLGKFLPSGGLLGTPYLRAWKESAFLHPIFSLNLSELLHKAMANWQLEKSGTRQYPMREKQLQFLAMLWASGCIKQDAAGLPSPKVVETHFPRLIELLSWKYETASERVSFPKLHVWKGAVGEDQDNIFANVPNWLTVCEAWREEYENVARSRQKEAKKKAHELALRSIRKQMYADLSLRRLWNWIGSQVPQIVLENNPDLEQLFFVEEGQIHVWTIEDIEALEALFLSHCETGTSVSFEVSKRIRQLTEWLNIYNDTFEVVVDASRFVAEWKGVPEPQAQQFPTRAAFLVARARWQLANKEAGNNQPNLKSEGEEL